MWQRRKHDTLFYKDSFKLAKAKMTEDSGCGGHDKKDDCECSNEEVRLEDVVRNNNVVINCLLGILIDKKVISEEDLQKKLAELIPPEAME